MLGGFDKMAKHPDINKILEDLDRSWDRYIEAHHELQEKHGFYVRPVNRDAYHDARLCHQLDGLTISRKTKEGTEHYEYVLQWDRKKQKHVAVRGVLHVCNKTGDQVRKEVLFHKAFGRNKKA